MTDIMADLQATAPLRDAFVRPYYMALLGTGFMRSRSDDDDLATRIAVAARAISDDDIETLLRMREWRGRLTAAWFIGLTRRSGFVGEVAALLLSSETVYAGRGYCVALGLVGGKECAAHLRAYLRKYLPLNGRLFDQTWAFAALAHIEGIPQPEFLDPSLWIDGAHVVGRLREMQVFGDVEDFVRRNKGVLMWERRYRGAMQGQIASGRARCVQGRCAPRQVARWPAAILERTCTRRCGGMWPGRRDGASDTNQGMFRLAQTGIASAASNGWPVFITPKHSTSSLRIAATTICLPFSRPCARAAPPTPPPPCCSASPTSLA